MKKFLFLAAAMLSCLSAISGCGNAEAHTQGDVSSAKAAQAKAPNDERKALMVFTGGCDLCSQALINSLKIAEKHGYRVVEYKIDGPEAASFGLKSAPSVVFDGKVLFTSVPTEKELEAALKKASS